MLVFINDGTLQFATVTLAEKQDFVPTSYIFKFTHTTTKNVIEFTIASTEDVSNNKKRYNEFELGSHFINETTGQYKYQIICSDTSNVLENGSMILKGVDVQRKVVNNSINAKVYNG